VHNRLGHRVHREHHRASRQLYLSRNRCVLHQHSSQLQGIGVSNGEALCDMEKEFKPITKLLDIVLLNCPGRVDEWVWPYIEICMSRITTSKDRGFSTLLMNVVAAALVYNSELTLKALEMNGKTTEVCGSLSVDTLHHFVLACSDSVSCFARTTVSSLFCDAGVYTVVSDD
jgi:hypothetical protein